MIRFFVAFVLLLLAGNFPVLAWQGDQRQLPVGATERTFNFYRPASLTRDEAVPLVIMLHGGLGSGQQAENAYGWDVQADKSGFVVVYPDGLDRTWNAGGCCGRAAHEGVDDLGFLTALIRSLVATENIDPSRVYMTGMSNGAAMSYRYACEGEFPVAAYGMVAGSLAVDCAHPRAVSLTEIHGLADQHVPMEGGVGTEGISKFFWAPVMVSINKLRQGARCGVPLVSQAGAVTTEKAICPQGNEVTLITIKDAGHQWPGAEVKKRLVTRLLALDQPSQALDATADLWAFFARHRAYQGH